MSKETGLREPFPLSSEVTYLGVVTDNNDPEKLGRVRFKVPEVLGDVIHPLWAQPIFPSTGNNIGFLFLPEVRQFINIIFEKGNINRPRWNSAPYSNANPVPEEAKANYPNVRIIKTKTGYLLYDDTDNTIKLVNTKQGSSIELDASGGQVILGSKIELKTGASSPTRQAAYVDSLIIDSHGATGRIISGSSVVLVQQ